jgi:hypothetical protein
MRRVFAWAVFGIATFLALMALFLGALAASDLEADYIDIGSGQTATADIAFLSLVFAAIAFLIGRRLSRRSK